MDLSRRRQAIDKRRAPRHHRARCFGATSRRDAGPLGEVDTEPFWIALIVGFLVQGWKGLWAFLRTGHWNLRRFFETGGMPSAHSAAVSALSMSVGLEQGFRSTLFGVTLYFSLIVMYDAAGLRRAAGRQAAVLNRLIERQFRDSEGDTHKLMELLGHTPFEVFVGSSIGVASALIWNLIHPLNLP